MLELQLALEAKLSESSEGSTSPLARASSPSPQDGAARAAAGQLGIFSPAGVVCSAKGPAWTRGELEPPQGAERAASGLAAAVYTPEQQERLGVDEAGTAKGLLHTVASSPRTKKATFADEPRREEQGGGGEPELSVLDRIASSVTPQQNVLRGVLHHAKESLRTPNSFLAHAVILTLTLIRTLSLPLTLTLSLPLPLTLTLTLTL